MGFLTIQSSASRRTTQKKKLSLERKKRLKSMFFVSPGEVNAAVDTIIKHGSDLLLTKSKKKKKDMTKEELET